MLASDTHQPTCTMRMHISINHVTLLPFPIPPNHAVPTLVSFWAPWCGPCRMIKPILEQIQEEYGGKLNLAQINTDENQVRCMRFWPAGLLWQPLPCGRSGL